ncbi:hypothetical protein ACIQCM_10705 [Pseudarthrobacter sp. NPDC092439]|uniref:hypothetical protein n=1 Tax=unclassified Pseudarthrobacter TaxID=2647000 RepID=UPI003824DF94
MHKIRRAVQAVFVLTLLLLLLGGVMFVAGQAVALAAGQGQWLEFFNTTFKDPMCIAASVCAVAGFLLTYQHGNEQGVAAREATTSR